MTTIEQLSELGKKLSPSALSEVLDFAMFLHQKDLTTRACQSLPLKALAGGLENSTVLADSPQSIQKALRNEWN